MPIDYKQYHPDWKTVIRPAILERDKNCCKFCGLKNGLWISRWKKEGLVKDLINGDVWQYDENGRLVRSNYSWRMSDWGCEHMSKVVLTIAHLDHDKTNNDYDNLAALCQKCHLGIDLKHHMANARETLIKKKKLQKLF